MPTHDFVDIGDVLNYEWFQGTIVSVDASTDTCVVSVDDQNYASLLFWHSEDGGELRSNGAIKGSASNFSAGDEVIFMHKIGSDRVEDAKVFTGGQMLRVMIKWKQIAIDPSFIALCDQMIARMEQEKIYAAQFKAFIDSDIIPWIDSWVGKKIRAGGFIDALMY